MLSVDNNKSTTFADNARCDSKVILQEAQLLLGWADHTAYIPSLQRPTFDRGKKWFPRVIAVPYTL